MDICLDGLMKDEARPPLVAWIIKGEGRGVVRLFLSARHGN